MHSPAAALRFGLTPASGDDDQILYNNAPAHKYPITVRRLVRSKNARRRAARHGSWEKSPAELVVFYEGRAIVDPRFDEKASWISIAGQPQAKLDRPQH